MELGISLNKTNKLTKNEKLRFILFLLLFLGIVLSTATFIHNMQYDSDNNNNNKEKWENDSGKSGKHKNMKAKEAAKEKWLKAKENLKQLEKQKRTKEISKQIQKAKREIKHWLKKMNETGETHWKQGK